MWGKLFVPMLSREVHSDPQLVHQILQDSTVKYQSQDHNKLNEQTLYTLSVTRINLSHRPSRKSCTIETILIASHNPVYIPASSCSDSSSTFAAAARTSGPVVVIGS